MNGADDFIQSIVNNEGGERSLSTAYAASMFAREFKRLSFFIVIDAFFIVLFKVGSCCNTTVIAYGAQIIVEILFLVQLQIDLSHFWRLFIAVEKGSLSPQFGRALLREFLVQSESDCS